MSMRLPIVVISGFLGAGKTTLLNHILQHPEGRKLGVIVNDVDSLNIDANLVRASDENKIALSNGCICCSLQQDLVTTVKQLAEGEAKLDAIVIETSGVTDPLSLAVAIRLLEDRGVARLETLVYLIDAWGIDQLDFDDGELVFAHAAISDLVLLSHGDLVPAKALHSVIERVSSAIAGQPVIQINAIGQPQKINLQWFFSPSFQYPRVYPQDSSHHWYQSWSKRVDRCLDRDRFEQFVRELAQSVWRSKGLVTFSDDPAELFQFHQVGSRASIEKVVDSTAEIEAGCSGIVVIFKAGDLNREGLEHRFDALVDRTRRQNFA